MLIPSHLRGALLLRLLSGCATAPPLKDAGPKLARSPIRDLLKLFCEPEVLRDRTARQVCAIYLLNFPEQPIEVTVGGGLPLVQVVTAGYGVGSAHRPIRVISAQAIVQGWKTTDPDFTTFADATIVRAGDLVILTAAPIF